MRTLNDNRGGRKGYAHGTVAIAGAAAEATTALPDRQAAGGASRLHPTADLAKAPRITAIEIENFKGISRRVRIDLRPITLLFGYNSVGKSTVLEALCYAHEILAGGNVDAHRLVLGGDQIDLGGFRRFVHGRDLERVVRLRFELNLEDWRVPGWLVQRISVANDLPGMAEAAGVLKDVQIEEWAPNGFGKSGWVALAVRWESSRPVVDSYEVGVNELLVGRLLAGRSATGRPVRLAYNVDHPLFDGLCGVGDQGDTGAAHDKLPQADVHNLASPLPKWELLDPHMTGTHGFQDARSVALFKARLSSMLVGVGDFLRGALATTRYIGTARGLRPAAVDPPSGSDVRGWSDGAAAWDRLLWDSDYPGATPDARRLLDDVNDWLARTDRLDTGYKLRMRATVELPADDGPVATIAAQRQMEEGAAVVQDLTRRIVAAPVRRTLELVTAQAELPVRTPEIGMGISPLLPVVVAALDPDRPGITAIEQPELHAHPKLQVELGDLFAPPGGERRVFLLDGHSEHLILRLLRRIEETTDGDLPEGKPALRPDQVSVIYLYAIGGAIHAKRLRIDETGEFIDRWPQGFFDERGPELFGELDGG